MTAKTAKTPKTPKTPKTAQESFTAEERAAMKERSAELRKQKKGADAEAEVLAKIAEMPDADRVVAERLHRIVKENAPELQAKTWYGMPAYARDGKVLCFFQPAAKFGTRYSTFGFNDVATLDDGAMWPVTYAVTELTDEDAERIAALVRRAVA